MPYPSVVTAFTNPQANDRLNSPSHSSIESAQNTGLTELQTFVGTLSSIAGTLIYDIRATASNGGGHVQTANKGGTGQTLFIKGDILVAQSSSVLSKLAIGTDGQALIADSTKNVGIKWGSGNTAPNVQVYASPSVLTWNRPSVLSYIVVEVQAAGGGGTSTSGNVGSGAGAGAYSRRVIPASALGLTETVTIGTGGTPGNAGGDSKFTYATGVASILSRGGAAGGAAGGNSIGGSGGTATGGDININGGDGSSGALFGVLGAISGGGGSSYFGGGGKGGSAANAGASNGGNGEALGSGGGGAASGGAGGAGTGGTGKDGLVIIHEF